MDACSTGELDAEVVIVISNNSKSGALRRAREAGIHAVHISGKTHPDGESDAILEALVSAQVDWVLTLGYMKKVGDEIISIFRNKILNTHPSLLPKYGGTGYYGIKVHEAVIKAGDLLTGASIHIVTHEYDRGPVIAQSSLSVLQKDTPESLQQRVSGLEKNILISVLKDKSVAKEQTCHSE